MEDDADFSPLSVISSNTSCQCSDFPTSRHRVSSAKSIGCRIGGSARDVRPSLDNGTIVCRVSSSVRILLFGGSPRHQLLAMITADLVEYRISSDFRKQYTGKGDGYRERSLSRRTLFR
jgi:hypothetical protein